MGLLSVCIDAVYCANLSLEKFSDVEKSLHGAI